MSTVTTEKYLEDVRLRDVYRRDVNAVTGAIDTLTAQRRLLTGVSHRESTYGALNHIAKAIEALTRLRDELDADAGLHLRAILDAQ